MTRSTLSLLFTLLFILTLSAAERVPERHWPRWRGPSDSGSSSKGTYLASWSDSENVLWKVSLPGIGTSTPTVWGDQVFLTCPAEGQDCVLCYDWSGKKLWQTSVGKELAGKHRNGSGSNPSAVTDGLQVFSYFKSGTLAALGMDGRLNWSVNLQQKYGNNKLYWDLGTSPVISDKLVIVAAMHGGDSYVVALEKQGGEVAWKIERNYKTPVEGDHSYATPIVLREGKRETLLVWGAERLTAYNAADGSLLWSCSGFNPDARGNWVAVASFVVAGDMVVVPYGRGAHIAGIQLGGKGDVTDTHRAWTLENKGSFVPTPATDGTNVYVLRDSGQVLCIDAASGETRWEGNFPNHRSKYYASPVIADGKIYAPREDGVLLVASITDGFKLLSENNMQQRLIASPVPVGNRLLIRGERDLFCIGK